MHRSGVFAAAVAGIGLVTTLTTATHAYSVAGYKWNSAPVPFYVNPANQDVSANAAISAIQSGMNTWNSQTGSWFRFSYAGQVSDTAATVDRRNVIVFRNEAKPDGSAALATTYNWSSDGVRIDSDIIFWDGKYQFYTGSSGCDGVNAYIEDVVTHELGHSLGLMHSSVTDATMYSTYKSCSTTMRTLAADDITGLTALYPGSGTNTAPTVAITAPTSNISITQGTSLTLSGSASDTQDGNLSAKLQWQSNIDGAIGTGSSLSKILSQGTHTITATVVDSGGLSAARQVSVTVTALPLTNTAPSVTITTPVNNSSVPEGTSLTFAGSASDTQDGILSAKLQWQSSLDGTIGTGSSFSKILSKGTHTISATVADSGGLSATKQVTVTVTVLSVNDAPSVTITAPANNISVAEGTFVTFSGSATDNQDGNLSAKLQWKSSVAGAIGTGSSFSKVLTAGTHTITASVLDSGGLSGSNQVTVTIIASTSTTSRTLNVKSYRVKGDRKADLTWSGFSSTSVDIYRSGTRIATTNNDRFFTDAIDQKGKGSQSYRVCEAGTSTCSNDVSISFE